jgi:hypothetical protein
LLPDLGSPSQPLHTSAPPTSNSSATKSILSYPVTASQSLYGSTRSSLSSTPTARQFKGFSIEPVSSSDLSPVSTALKGPQEGSLGHQTKFVFSGFRTIRPKITSISESKAETGLHKALRPAISPTVVKEMLPRLQTRFAFSGFREIRPKITSLADPKETGVRTEPHWYFNDTPHSAS